MINFADGNYNVIGKEMTSWDGTYSIAVPHGWKKCDRASANALISAERADSGMYTQMTLDTYDYAGTYGVLPTVDQYITNYIAYISGNSDDGAQTKMISAPVEMELEGVKGQYYEFSVLSDNITVCFYCFAGHVDAGFITIDTMVKDIDQAQGKDIANSILKSFRINTPEEEVPEEGLSSEETPAGEAPAEGEAPVEDDASAKGQ